MIIIVCNIIANAIVNTFSDIIILTHHIHMFEELNTS